MTGYLGTPARWATRAAALALAMGTTWCRQGPTHGAGLALARYNQENALWIQSSYLRGYRPSTGKEFTDDDVIALGHLLRERHIKNAYLFAGPFDREGKVPAYATAPLAIRRVQLLRQTDPDLRIMPWLGGLERKEVWLEDAEWVNGAIEETARVLLATGTTALHMNFEYLLFGQEPDPLLRYGERFQAFFEKLRARLPGVFVSTVVTSTAPDTKAWKYKHSPAEIARVARYIDQLAVLYFDTHIRDETLFERDMRLQLDHFDEWRAVAPHPQLLLGTGTFVNHGAKVEEYRDLAIENPSNHLRVLRELLVESDRVRAVDGIAIFCDWETDEDEWKTLRTGWLDLADDSARERGSE